MAGAPPPPRRLIRQNAVFQENFELPPVPQIQALGNAAAVPVAIAKPKPISQPPRSNLPRTEKERKRLRSSRSSTRRRRA